VGWIESIGGVGQLRESPHESAQFGRSIGRLTIGANWREDCATPQDLRESIEEVVTTSALDDIILRAPSDLVGLINQCDFGARRAYAAGTLLYWERNSIAEWPRPSAPPASLSIATFADAIDREAASEAAMVVLANTFLGYQNHYASNPALPETSATDAYLDWAERAMRDAPEVSFLGRIDAELAGIIVAADLEPEVDALEILLAGVHSDFRNQGIYTALLSAVVDDAAVRGRSKVYLSTQAHNIPSQRAWVVLGFKPCYSVDTFHLQKGPHHAR
jgi:ribosomal protein S18 acetylase RimI-like enzyme